MTQNTLYEDMDRVVRMGAGHGYRVGVRVGYEQAQSEHRLVRRQFVWWLVLAGVAVFTVGIVVGVVLGVSA